MTATIHSIENSRQGKYEEVFSQPEWDEYKINVVLDEMLPLDDVVGGVHAADIQFHVTHEGLIINVTDNSGEIVGTSSETFDEICARLALDMEALRILEGDRHEQ